MLTQLRSAGRTFQKAVLVASALLLAACVTINVYFPAAEAQQAAKEFVDKVIGDEMPPGDDHKDENKQPSAALQPRFHLMSLLISDAQAAADITIRTPAIQAIQSRMGADSRDWHGLAADSRYDSARAALSGPDFRVA